MRSILKGKVDLILGYGVLVLEFCARFFWLFMTDRTIIVQIPEIKNPNISILNTLGNLLAEKEGFEPPEVWPSTVFKTAAFDHSAISPRDANIIFIVFESIDFSYKI